MNSKRLTLSLAVIAAAVLNIACWWIFSSGNPETEETFITLDEENIGLTSDAEKAPLEIAPTRVYQQDFTTNRIVSLAVTFNRPVSRKSLTPTLFEIRAGGSVLGWKYTRAEENRIHIETTEPVNTNAVTVTVARGIESLIKGVPASNQDYEFVVPVSNNFGINEIRLDTPPFEAPQVVVEFTKRPDWSKVSDYVVCNPPVELSFSGDDFWSYYTGGNLKISGDFEIGRSYTLTFRKGMPTDDGFSLDSTMTRTFTIPHRSAAIAFEVSGRYLPPEGGLAIPVKIVNATNAEVSVAAVLPQNIVQLMARENDRYRLYRNYWYDDDGRSSADGSATLELSGKPITGNITLDGPVDSVQQKNLRLSEYMGGATRGIFLVGIHCEDRYNGSQRSAQRLVCVSDLGISARIAKKTAHVWVTSLREGTPVADARVDIYSASNLKIGSGVSGFDGVAKIEYSSSEAEPFVVTATSADGSDLSFISLAESTSVDEKTKASGTYLKPGECTAYVFSDRGIYRHGDTIHLQGLLRNAEAKAPAPFPVSLEITKPSGGLYRSLTVMPEASGSLVPAEAISIPEDQPSGEWTFTFSMPGEKGAELGSRRVTVESFVPPQIRVNFTSLPEDELFNNPLAFSIHAEHLFGKPADGLKAEASVTYGDAKFKPEGWKGYRFGNTDRAVKSNYMKLGTGRFDANGDASFTLVPDPKVMPAEMLEAVVEGTAFEPGGRPVSMRAVTYLHRYPFYIGIQAPESTELTVSETNILAFAAVDRNGKRSSEPRDLDISLFSLSHIYGYTQNPRGQYVWKDEIVKSLVSSRRITTSPDADAPFPFALNTTGDYMIIATDSKSEVSSSYTFSVTANGQSNTRSSLANPAKIDMTFDKKDYVAGDIANLKITSPFTGTALLSLQREDILETIVMAIANTTTSIGISVTPDMYPNIQATVSIIRPAQIEQSWSAHRASGIAVLNVTRPDDKLQLDCDTAVEIVDGGSTLTVTLAVNGAAPGEPCHATVFATDEAIHTLTDEKVPDPFGFFSATCESESNFYDLFSLLMPITADTVNANAARIGGDGDDGLMRRISPVPSRRFKPLSLVRAFTGVVGEDGKCVFTLPEFAGEVRVTAVAWTASASGATSKQVKVSPKIILRPDAPRFLGSEDSTELTLAIYNQSGTDCNVTYSVEFGGCITGDAETKMLEMKTGENKILRLKATTFGEIGTGIVTFKAEGAGEKHTETLGIPVRPAMPLETTTDCIALEKGKTFVFEIPEGVVPSTVEQSIRCHNSYYARFAPALSYLLQYPYGCLEQTTSSAFPLVYAGGALARLAVTDTFAIDEVRSKVNSAIVRVSAMQGNRGYNLWYDVSNQDDGTSVYACHFLAEAGKAGHLVSKSVLDANAQFLRRTAYETQSGEKKAISAYCCHVLALSGQPERSSMLALYDMKDGLTELEKAHLSRAFALSGDRQRALKLMKSVNSAPSLEAAAFGILAWLEIDDPESEKRIASLYSVLLAYKGKDPHWMTTHDNALALLAIGAMSQRYADPKAELVVDVKNADGTVLNTVTNGSAIIKTGPIQISVTNNGKGVAYILRTVSAVPTKLSFKEKSSGIAITRAYRNADGMLIDPSTLTLGDSVVVELSLALHPDIGSLDDAVIDELLPACLEPDTGSLESSGTYPWIPHPDVFPVMRREVRDDRLIFFMNRLSKETQIYYAARVVSAGTFTIPPAAVEGMYRPEICARTAPETMIIKE